MMRKFWERKEGKGKILDGDDTTLKSAISNKNALDQTISGLIPLEGMKDTSPLSNTRHIVVGDLSIPLIEGGQRRYFPSRNFKETRTLGEMDLLAVGPMGSLLRVGQDTML